MQYLGKRGLLTDNINYAMICFGRAIFVNFRLFMFVNKLLIKFFQISRGRGVAVKSIGEVGRWLGMGEIDEIYRLKSIFL